MNKLLILIVIIFTTLVFTKNAEAKVLPQSTNTAAKQTSVKSGGTTIGVYPKLRVDRKALIVNFTNLQNAKSVSYLLTYLTNNQQEGARGSLNIKGAANTSQELLFGTCSKNVCRYHTNIKDAKLEVSYTSQTGKRYLKRFKIKV